MLQYSGILLPDRQSIIPERERLQARAQTATGYIPISGSTGVRARACNVMPSTTPLEASPSDRPVISRGNGRLSMHAICRARS